MGTDQFKHSLVRKSVAIVDNLVNLGRQTVFSLFSSVKA